MPIFILLSLLANQQVPIPGTEPARRIGEELRRAQELAEAQRKADALRADFPNGVPSAAATADTNAINAKSPNSASVASAAAASADSNTAVSSDQVTIAVAIPEAPPVTATASVSDVVGSDPQWSDVSALLLSASFCCISFDFRASACAALIHFGELLSCLLHCC